MSLWLLLVIKVILLAGVLFSNIDITSMLMAECAFICFVFCFCFFLFCFFCFFLLVPRVRVSSLYQLISCLLLKVRSRTS